MLCKMSASCKLPVVFGDQILDMYSFDCGRGEGEVIVLMHKSKDIQPNTTPYVRIHSACITGEVFGSQKCDCGFQFDEAMRTICDSEYGIMIYMSFQEGRGIGLTNKVRAYQLQEEGADTLKANELLGFEHDARDFSPAAEVLKYLGVDKINLLTNNPEKTMSFEKTGIHVENVIPLCCPVNQYNRDYIMTKKNTLNHTFGALAFSGL
jgi:3,4-dihydroxy 2-butanone 4-phosphate synthase/GTP cyclohydrolase II